MQATIGFLKSLKGYFKGYLSSHLSGLIAANLLKFSFIMSLIFVEF